jgi:hypothetical protein
MRRTPLLPVSIALLGLALSVVFFVGLATAALRERRFFSARHGVGVEAPTGWTLSQHTGYPDIIVVLLHPDGSRISLSVAPTSAADARALAEQSRRGLEAQHLTVARVAAGPRGGTVVDARNPSRGSELRQLYLVRPVRAGKRQAIVLTLVARAETLTSATLGLDWAISHLELAMPAGPAETPDAGARER